MMEWKIMTNKNPLKKILIAIKKRETNFRYDDGTHIYFFEVFLFLAIFSSRSNKITSSFFFSWFSLFAIFEYCKWYSISYHIDSKNDESNDFFALRLREFIFMVKSIKNSKFSSIVVGMASSNCVVCTNQLDNGRIERK